MGIEVGLAQRLKGIIKKKTWIILPSESISMRFFFFALYRSALDPRMNFNKFETGTLSNVTGSCIKPTKFSKNIAFTPKRIEFLNLPSRTDLTSSWLTKKMNSADEEYNYNLWCKYSVIFNYLKNSYCTTILIAVLYFFFFLARPSFNYYRQINKVYLLIYW